MQVVHHGAHEGVTGSCHELQITDRRSILVDCGLFQGKDADKHLDREIDFRFDHVDALLLTHVHIDHIGRTPYLLREGFRRPIYCTPPTAKLLPLMLEDAIKLGMTRRSDIVIDILKEVRRLTRVVPYDRWEKMDGGLQFRFQQAGHVLGSAYIETEYQDERFVFGGDLGSTHTPLIRDPVSPERADFLVLESTYGDRLHDGRERRVEKLEQILCHTLANSGVTIIPAFSLGRTQELLYEMNQIFEHIEIRQCRSLIHAIDVIVDSPLANRLTSVYDDMREYWDDEAIRLLSIDNQPLAFKNLFEIDKQSRHQGTIEYLKRQKRPAVVIAGSGMCTGGRVIDWLKHFIGFETTDIVFVGYQAEGTPGRQILDGAPSVTLEGKTYPIRAKIHKLTGYSAHADQSDLIRFVEGIPTPPREIRLVHGEAGPKEALQKKLQELGYNATTGNPATPAC